MISRPDISIVGKFYAIMALYILVSTSPAQTTWTGATNRDFSLPSNWSNGLPSNDGTATPVFGVATNYDVSLVDLWHLAGMTFTSDLSTGYTFSGSTLTLSNGTVSNLSNQIVTFAAPLVIEGTVTMGNSLNYIVIKSSASRAPISGSGNLVIGGRVDMRNTANTYSGTTTINPNGTLFVLGDGEFGTSPATATPSSLVFNGGTLLVQGGGTIASTRGIAITADSTLSFVGPGALTYGGIITGSSALSVSGPDASLTLTGANTYSGTLTLSSGNLYLTGSTLAAATLNLTDTGNLFFRSTNVTIGALSGSRQISPSSTVALTVGSNNASTTYSGVFSGVGNSLIKTGTGTFTLTGNNSYTAGTAVNAGTLLLGSANTLRDATGTLTVNGGILASSVASTTIGGNLTLLGGKIALNGTGAGTLVFRAGKNFTMSGGTLDFTLGPVSDLLAGSGGALSITGGAFNFVFDSGFDYNNSYQVFTGFSSSSISGLALTGYDTAHYTASLSNAGLLTFTSAIPEPATYAAIAGLACLSLAIGWRQRRAR